MLEEMRRLISIALLVSSNDDDQRRSRISLLV
jgi:hypothetical protein